MEYDSFLTHDIDLFMGKPKSGKTLIIGSAPKPLLYIAVGNDGGGRVLLQQYRKDIQDGLIKVKNLRNDPIVGSKIKETSIEKLARVLAELRQPGADKFKTIAIDTLGGLQDDYKSYLEFNKGGKALAQPEWGDVQKMMLSIKDNMKRFSEERGVKFIWISHTREQEVYETSGLNKEIRIIPDLTISTGTKFMKDASNIFYCCRKTIILPDGTRDVKFLTYIGPHPLMDTGTRDIKLAKGGFIEDFTYDKWRTMVDNQSIETTKVITPEIGDNENNKTEEE